MKKFFILSILLFTPVICEANNLNLDSINAIQTRIDSVGTNILNNNKITRRVVFTYDEREKKKKLTTDKALTKRQIIIYDGLYNSVQTDDELAALISREISTVIKSYDGVWGGTIDSIQVALSSKKFETAADKRAVDFMVNAGYNPLALIVYINKTCPQKRFDRFSRHNLTSKRLARIYEYITYKYPQYLENNEYLNNKYYQNFLLTSIENRKKLEEKIKYNQCKEIKYE
ncbi:MAG: hypothetical protein K2F57_02485 [Candidatus Gastranaerophilales bacterium]|nr:hypothetical protein [Candidatus Gastranaerophilales bacterium]